MKNENEMTDSLSRRSLLGQAVGAAGILSALGSTGQANAQAPPARRRPRRGRVRDSFDFGWKFFKGDAPGAQQPDFADASWRDVDLPHDWSIEGPFSQERRLAARGALSCPRVSAGTGNTSTFPNLTEAERYSSSSRAFISSARCGSTVSTSANGRTGSSVFAYDLTPHLKYGGDNVIAVKADNSHQPNCRWYSGSGIYRHTWLLVTSQVHVADWGTFVTTPQVDMDSAIVQVKTRVQNEGKSAVECTADQHHTGPGWEPGRGRAAEREQEHRQPTENTSSCSRYGWTSRTCGRLTIPICTRCAPR